MSIEEKLSELIEAIAELSQAIKGGGVAAPIVEEKPKKAKPAVKKKAEAPAPAPEPVATDEPVSTTPALNKEAVLRGLLPIVQEKGTEIVAQIMKELGATDLSSLDPAKYPKLIKMVEAATGMKVQI